MDFIDFLKYECDMRDEALKRVENLEKFAKWVAGEIMPEIEWLNNQNAFPELACRRLEKLGLVKADGDKWVLVGKESHETD